MPSALTTTSSREKTRIERRAEILAHTAAIVAERGYHGFGLQELATRCGLTKAGLLHHFPSKDQLLIAVLRDRDRQDEIAVNALAGLEGTSGDVVSRSAMIAAFHAIVARNATRPELVRLYAMLRAEALSPDHPAHDFFGAREAATLDLFEQMIAPHAASPRSVARQAMALMIGLELQWLREDLGFDLVAEWDCAITTLFP